jgi:hypothetical protein
MVWVCILPGYEIVKISSKILFSIDRRLYGFERINELTLQLYACTALIIESFWLAGMAQLVCGMVCKDQCHSAGQFCTRTRIIMFICL